MKSKRSIGGKAYNLSIIESMSFNVPRFLVVEPSLLNDTLEASMLAGSVQHLTNSDSQEFIQLEFDDLELEDLDREAMNTFLSSLLSDSSFLAALGKRLKDELNNNSMQYSLYAVRSSALLEDGREQSFAGQLDSFLNVNEMGLAQAVVKVWLSAYSQRVATYQELTADGSLLELPSVIIQEMLKPDKAGVAFGLDPVNGDRQSLIITSVDGTADKLVDGYVNGKTYVFKEGKLTSQLGQSDGALSLWQLKKIQKAVISLEHKFDHPQDVEWAFENNKLYILQSRDITTTKKIEIEKPTILRVDIFDNSNIGESYPGITTPLTFSFARTAYENVYLQFSVLMGVSNETIHKNSEIFPQMLGFIKGRIYYNLLNWYRLLKLFPGYKTNRAFMEGMMGVSDSIDPNDLLEETKNEPSSIEKVNIFARMIISVVGLIREWCLLERNCQRFQTRLDVALNKIPDNLDSLHALELAKIYRGLESDLLKKWDAPIVNDFFAMIFYGLLKKLSSSWIEEEGIHNQLLCGETGIISTEPTRLINQMTDIASGNNTLLQAIAKATRDSDLTGLTSHREFYCVLEEYLARFGDRSPGELKLESQTFNDNPALILKSVLGLAKRDSLPSNYNAHEQRDSAEALVNEKLKNNPLKKMVFHMVLSQARIRIKGRENLRYERTKVFAQVRKIFKALGKKLYDEKQLDDRDDIFFLEIEEVLRFVEGTATSTRLSEFAKIRNSEHEQYKLEAVPADRIRMVNGANTGFVSELKNIACHDIEQSSSLKGTGACPGIIRGRVKVILDPMLEDMEDFDILVAQRTDPGWITLISQAKGILVEYGSLLSHTAIVARELGIPTIVAVPEVTSQLASGDLIELNGSTGSITLLEASSLPAPGQSEVA